MAGEGRGTGVLGHPAGGIESGRLAELFGLLSDPTRAGILYALLEAGPLSLEDLTTWTRANPSRVTDALRVLRSARVVTSRKAAKTVVYSLAGDRVGKLLELAARSAAARRLRFRGMDTSQSAW
jgi:ArsR family transcriptional regulator, lead/cadmium/zinc/bismuth-responsive transcriptional repressor